MGIIPEVWRYLCLKEYEEKHIEIQSGIVNHTSVSTSSCLQNAERRDKLVQRISGYFNLKQGPCFPWTNFRSKLHHKI